MRVNKRGSNELPGNWWNCTIWYLKHRQRTTVYTLHKYYNVLYRTSGYTHPYDVVETVCKTRFTGEKHSVAYSKELFVLRRRYLRPRIKQWNDEPIVIGNRSTLFGTVFRCLRNILLFDLLRCVRAWHRFCPIKWYLTLIFSGRPTNN